MAYLSGYSKYKVLTLTGGASGAQTNFQLKIAVSYEAAMQGDFDDIRFTQADGETLIDAWAELIITDTSATVWAEFPTTPANTVEQIYRMYYGNASASNDWDIGATALFGDDFPGTTLDTTNNWTIISGTPTVNSGLSLDDGERIDTKTWTANTASVRIKATVPNETGTTVYVLLGLAENTTSALAEFITYWNWDVRSNNDGTEEVTTIDAYNGEHIFEIEKNAAVHDKFYVDDVLKDTDTAYVYNGGIPIRLGKAGSNSLLIDWVFAHKYVANPPTYAFGAEQSAPTGHPTMKRWGGIPGMQYTGRRSW